MTASPSSENSYFDLHITGLGYLNRVREVTPKKGEPFLACDIAALNGPNNDVQYCRFDVRVSGSEAQHLIRRCSAAVDAKKKVLIGFRLGDLWTDIFTQTKGKNAGKPAVGLKARLLYIGWIKVDGQLVYKALPKASEPADEDVPVADDAFTPEAPATEGAARDESRGEALETAASF